MGCIFQKTENQVYNNNVLVIRNRINVERNKVIDFERCAGSIGCLKHKLIRFLETVLASSKCDEPTFANVKEKISELSKFNILFVFSKCDDLLKFNIYIYIFVLQKVVYQNK